MLFQCHNCSCETCEKRRLERTVETEKFRSKEAGKAAGKDRIDSLKDVFPFENHIFFPNIPEGMEYPEHWMLGYLDGLRTLIQYCEWTVQFAGLHAYRKGNIMTRLSK